MSLERVTAVRCNIGPDEIARRRRSATAMSAVVAIVAALLVGSPASPLVRFLLWPFATAAASTWLQVVHRFCVAFGALGLENFGRLGEESRIAAEQRATDRRRAFQVVLEGALVGLVVTIAIAAIPV